MTRLDQRAVSLGLRRNPEVCGRRLDGRYAARRLVEHFKWTGIHEVNLPDLQADRCRQIFERLIQPPCPTSAFAAGGELFIRPAVPVVQMISREFRSARFLNSERRPKGSIHSVPRFVFAPLSPNFQNFKIVIHPENEILVSCNLKPKDTIV
jgi:hypothetical protein